MSGPTPLPVFCFRFCGESFAFFRLFNPAKAVAAVDIDSVTSGDFYTSELGFRIVDLKTTAFAWRNWIWSQKSLMNKFKSLFVSAAGWQTESRAASSFRQRYPP